jgi:hypothetical protein
VRTALLVGALALCGIIGPVIASPSLAPAEDPTASAFAQTHELLSENADASDSDPTEWFANSAASVARSNAQEALPDLTAEEVANLTVGTPVNVVAFPSGNTSGWKETTVWVAPLYVKGVLVGTVATDYSDGKSHQQVVTSSTRFAEALAYPQNDTFIALEPKLATEETLGGWFLVDGDGQVSPLDPVAESVLAGSVSLDQYRQLRSDFLRASSDDVADSGTADSGVSDPGGIVRTAILIIAVLLVVLAIIVWLRHEFDEPDAPKEQHNRNRSESGRRILRHGADRVQIYEVPAEKEGRNTGIIPRVAPRVDESDTDEHSDH